MKKPCNYFDRALVILSIVNEFAMLDGWDNLDECMGKAPALLESYMSLAEVSLRVIENRQPYFLT